MPPMEGSKTHEIVTLIRQAPDLTAAEIAERLNTSISTVNMAAYRHNVPIRRLGTSRRQYVKRVDLCAKIEAILKAEPGITYREIAERLGSTEKRVYATMRYHPYLKEMKERAPRRPPPAPLRDAILAVLAKEPNLTAREIAERLNRPAGTVHSCICMHGITVVQDVPRITWTPALLDELRRAALEEPSASKVMQRTELSHYTVIRGLMKLVRQYENRLNGGRAAPLYGNRLDREARSG